MSEKKQFWGATLFTGIQSGVRLGVNYVLGKIAAVYLGPVGLGLLGQFQSLALIVQNFSNGAIHNGIIKYLSAARKEEDQRKLLQTAFTISVFLGLVSGLLVFIFSPLLNRFFLNLPGYRIPFAFLGAACVFFSLNVLLTSIFNALKDYRSLAYFNMLQSICSLLLFIPLTWKWGITGALISVVLFQVMGFIAGYLLYYKKYKHIFRLLGVGIDKKVAVNLGEYSLMTLFTVTTFSVSQLLIRAHLINVSSKTTAGLWEGLNRISNFYLYFVAFLITAHMLPRYAEATDRKSLTNQLTFNLSRLIPMMGAIILVVYLLRNLLIRFIFSNEFLPLSDVMSWHLVGDFLKITAWIFSNFLVARKYTRAFVITDFLYHTLFVSLSLILCKTLKDVTMAYAFSSLVYILILIPPAIRLMKKEFISAEKV